MTKEQYNLLAPYQKEAYDKKNKRNKRLLIVGWIVGAVTAILVVVNFGVFKDIKDIKDIFEALLGCLVIGLYVGGIFPGLAHFGFLLKKIKFDSAILLAILLGIFIIMLYSALFSVAVFTGWICLIIDTILFIMEEPLIYRWEDKRVLAKAEVPVGMVVSDPSAADKLHELKNMLDSGLITEAEFDRKKDELLNNL